MRSASWTTSCAGCHLPIQANWKSERQHYEGGETRNYATYNPQVARDEMFLLGRRGPSKGNKIAPVRSSSALVLSSTNANRERIYIQQAPIAASGLIWPVPSKPGAVPPMGSNIETPLGLRLAPEAMPIPP